MEHKLHVRKVLIARDKLRPLNEQEMLKKAAVLHEEKSVAARTGEVRELERTVDRRARDLKQRNNCALFVECVLCVEGHARG